jgi:hypothetical protein
MDGGSGLNLLFASTMKAMRLSADMLKESDTGFHGIIPTRPAYPLGKISLRCVFFGGEFFEEFSLTIGLCHGDI